MTASQRWYAVRLRPGMSRNRIGNSATTLAEQDLQDAGFTFWSPVEIRDIVHHRTRKLVEKRFPLIPGYAFVADVTNFWKLSELKCVAGIVGVEGRPMVIPAIDIVELRRVEEELLARTTDVRQKRAEAAAKSERAAKMTRRGLKNLYPTGSSISVKSGFLSMEVGTVVDVGSKKTVKVMLDRLQNLGVVELSVDDLALVA